MTLFYAPHIAISPLLPESEAQHAARVLRMNKGDEITLTDGKGLFYQAVITQINSGMCAVHVTSRRQPPTRSFRIHLAVAPTKNAARMEWMAEKATEIGVDAITLLSCRFSERRQFNTERIRKLLVSAMKQSHSATLPELNEVTPFDAFVCREHAGLKFIAHCAAHAPAQLLQHHYRAHAHATILIGPEGDFAQSEIALALQHGFAPVSLGQSRLRTETAALVACHTCHILSDASPETDR